MLASFAKVVCGLFAILLVAGPAWLAAPTPAGESVSTEEALNRILLSGESPAIASRLQSADQLALEKPFDALQEYEGLLQEVGSKELAPETNLSGVGCLHTPMCPDPVQLCFERIVRLPAALLRLHRTRVDGQAKKWLQQGIAHTRPP